MKEWREEGKILKVDFNQLNIGYVIAKYLYFNDIWIFFDVKSLVGLKVWTILGPPKKYPNPYK